MEENPKSQSTTRSKKKNDTKDLRACGSSTSSNGNLLEVEVAALGAENINTLSALLGHATVDVVQVDIGDGSSTAGLASRTFVGVVLLDDDTIVGDAGHGGVRVGDVVDLAAGRVGVGLDADCVRRVDDGISLDHDTINNRTSLDGTLLVKLNNRDVSLHTCDIYRFWGENKRYAHLRLYHLQLKYRVLLHSSYR